MHSFALLVSLLSAAAAVPTPDTPQLKNILVPNENGELVYATPDQIKARMPSSNSVAISKRDTCDEPDPFNTFEFTCFQFCERHVEDFTGKAEKVSASIDCTVATCAVAKAEAIAIMEKIEIGITGTSGAGEKGGATIAASVSYAWSSTRTTTETYTFNPAKGDRGYIAFHPYFKKSCGRFIAWDIFVDPPMFNLPQCVPDYEIDDNACGTSPKGREDGTADGVYSFCNENTGEGC